MKRKTVRRALGRAAWKATAMTSKFAGSKQGYMATAALPTVTLNSPRAGTVVCAAAGEVDSFTAPLLLDKLQKATADGPRHLIIDLSAVTFFSAAAFGVLMQARDMQKGGYELVLVGNARPVVRVLDICDPE